MAIPIARGQAVYQPAQWHGGHAALRDALGKVPFRVLIVDELPRNATGKVLKGPLRESACSSSWPPSQDA